MNHQMKRTPLLFLHGFPLNPTMWDAQREVFEGSHAVITPDLRVSVDTAPGAMPPPASMEQMADRAAQALDEAGFEQAVVVGFSMGGYVSFAFLEKYPERVMGLVLTDTKAEADSEEGKAGRKSLAEKVLATGAQAAVDAMLGKLLSPKTASGKPELVARTEAMMLAATPKAIASAALGMAERPDRTGMLPNIAVPTLVVVGEDDEITPPAGARKLAEAIPNGELAVIPDAGHLSNLEQPEKYNEALSLWLRKNGFA